MKNILLISLLLLSTTIFAQNVSISATANDLPDNSAMLDVKSTNMGVLIPRLTSQQRDAMPTKVEGLEIYNKSRKCFEFYTGTEWTSAVPAGTIQAYGGDTTKIPAGWLLCRGQAINRLGDYNDLFLVIGTNWGQGNGSATFNVPDLRGMFLRGTTGTRIDQFADPDLNTRTANGSGQKNNAGSFQIDDFKSHRHNIDRSSSGNNGGLLGGDAANLLGGAFASNLTGGSETRPKNAYVNYIIKY